MELAGASDTGNRALFKIRDIPGRGKGLVALVDIPPGTRILHDKPLFTLQARADENVDDTYIHILQGKLKALSKEKQREYLALHNNFKGTKHPFLGIFTTNALPCGPGSPIGGIYTTASRINHSCRPNAHNSWDEETKGENTYSIEFIKSGEEITITYTATAMSATERQVELQKKFGFKCQCRACDQPPSQLRASDARRIKMRDLEAGIDNPFRPSILRLRDCHTVLNLLREEYGKEATNTLFAQVYDDAFDFNIASGDEARASVCAEKARLCYVTCLGEESGKAKQFQKLTRNPKSCPQYGVADLKWAQKKEMVPQGLSEYEMERWLFRL